MFLSSTRAELVRRMGQPQRHRLLHGYPLPRLMQNVQPGASQWGGPSKKGLLVGVLPHSFCNPRVRGCGFCTFPHESFDKALMKRVTAAVIREIEHTAEREPHLVDRTVHGLYFGGGTANLTPPDQFREICRTLQRRFNLGRAEVTLEGVPRYFLSHRGALIDIATSELRAQHTRISMGIQTFDTTWQARMGRSSFGTQDQVAQVVANAASRDLTTSADLLVNLPDDSETRIERDIRTAADLGFHQICIYNLVLTPGMTTEWAQDNALTGAMPDHPIAFENWRFARGLLRALGYVQTTLTNFERADVARSHRRFTYERDSFHPDQFDAIGFGPAAISTFIGPNFDTGVKTVNAATSAQFVSDIERAGGATRQRFSYRQPDLRLLFLTRSLPLLTLSKPTYESLFGASIDDDYPNVLRALHRCKLIEDSDGDVRLTAKGMFYADAVAGTFAFRRASKLIRRTTPHSDGPVHLHMG